MPTKLRTCAEVNFLGRIHLEQWADVPCITLSAIRVGTVQMGSHQTAQLRGLQVMRACGLPCCCQCAGLHTTCLLTLRNPDKVAPLASHGGHDSDSGCRARDGPLEPWTVAPKQNVSCSPGTLQPKRGA